MLTVHRILGTWRRKVDAYIALTEFGKQKMIEAGFPEDKIFVKPNAIRKQEVQEFRSLGVQNGDFLSRRHRGTEGEDSEERKWEQVLYAGRLSPEKGAHVLLKAWKTFVEKRGHAAASVRLVIAGDGPERPALESLTTELGLGDSVMFMGHVTTERLQELMRHAAILVVPSLLYETFGMSIVEGYMQGLPALVSGAGGQGTLAQDGVTGWHFTMGDADDLAAKLAHALSDLPRLRAMGATARDWIAQSDSMEEQNVQRLVEIYRLC